MQPTPNYITWQTSIQEAI